MKVCTCKCCSWPQFSLAMICVAPTRNLLSHVGSKGLEIVNARSGLSLTAVPCLFYPGSWSYDPVYIVFVFLCLFFSVCVDNPSRNPANRLAELGHRRM